MRIEPGQDIAPRPDHYMREPTRRTDTSSNAQAVLLVVCRDDALRAELAACCRKSAPRYRSLGVTSAGAVDEALVPMLVIADLASTSLPFLERCKEERPGLPVLALTSRLHPELLNTCYELDIDLLCKPVPARHVMRFLKAALPLDAWPDDALGRTLRSQAREWGLTRREQQVLWLSVKGFRPHEIPERLLISRNTFRCHVKHLLCKAQQPTLASTVRHVLLRSGAR